MALRLYNTWSKKKDELEPLEPGKIGMYVCGVTVYDTSHIGHARQAIADPRIRYRHKQAPTVSGHPPVHTAKKTAPAHLALPHQGACPVGV